jgi:ribonuclease HI
MKRPRTPEIEANSTENSGGAKILPFHKPHSSPGLPFVEIWTDGGCDPSSGRGGYGAILTCKGHEREIASTERETTKQPHGNHGGYRCARSVEAPLCRPALHGLGLPQKSMTLWFPKWLATNFKKGKIKNADLWLRLEKAAKPHAADWQWITGHNGDVMNERAHNLSEEAGTKNTAPALARARAGQ